MANSPRTTITAPEAAKLCEVDRRTFAKLAIDAGLTIRTFPGQPARYIRSEVEAFINRCTTKGQPKAEAVVS